MLAPLGRCCWKQARLGKGALDVQQKGIAGNTILFAEPTAEIPSMELSPAHDALVESLNVGFSGKAHDLSKAHWAAVKRAEYMQHDLRQGVALEPRPHQVHALAEDVGAHGGEDRLRGLLPVAAGFPQRLPAGASHGPVIRASAG